MVADTMTPFDFGYDDYLNGGSLDYEPLNTVADNEYRSGWHKAKLDEAERQLREALDIWTTK